MSGATTDRCRQYLIKELQPSDEIRWDSFIERSDDGTFFHLSGWKKIISESLGHPTIYLYCEQDEQIIAVLPLAHVRSWLFGNALISLPFLVYGGVVSNDGEAARLLIAAACQRAKDLRVDCLELRNKVASGYGWPTKDIYATFSKSMDPDPEKNLLAIPRKQRAMIRKGQKAGLEVEIDADPNRLYTALLECKRNLGTPFFSRAYLQDICDCFKDKVEILTVTKNKKTICSVMSFRFGSEILPYYGGGGNDARNVMGNDFMYWSVMEKACREGVEVFDYGRSMVGTGAYRFKKHWGFEPKPLAYEFFLVSKDETPNLNPANPKFSTLINIWKKLPLAIAGQVGPHIARRLG